MADEISLRIDDVAFGGKGVGRHEGRAVFVPFTLGGERVLAEIVRQKKNWATARLLAVEEKSAQRVEPPCPYFGRCGGCSYQHAAYSEQLSIKARQVEQTLRRVGRFESVPMRPIVPSPKEFGYRNRIRVHVEGNTVGFYRHDRHELLDIEQCPIAAPEVNAELAALRRKPVRDGDYTLLARGRGQFFVQTNDAVAEALLTVVRGLVGREDGVLVDAYCGAGFFAKALKDKFSRVIGIEANAMAIEDARCSAGPNEEYLLGDVSARLSEVLQAASAANTTLLLDPPATGVEARVLDAILSDPPAELIYVSCDPATLARDLAGLGPACRLQSVTPLDMFPQTAEIEVVTHALLR